MQLELRIITENPEELKKALEALLNTSNAPDNFSPKVRLVNNTVFGIFKENGETFYRKRNGQVVPVIITNSGRMYYKSRNYYCSIGQVSKNK